MTDKQPPNSIDAERGLIGSLMIDPATYYDVSDFLKPEHFYSVKHGDIYKAIGNLHANKQPVDTITVSEVLAKKYDKPANETTADLIDFLNAVPTSINAASYGRIVHSSALRRRLMQQASVILNLAIDEKLPVSEMLEQAEKAIFVVSDGASMKEVTPLRDAILDVFDLTLERRDRGGQMVGIPTGFADLDRTIDGLQPKKLITIAGRPGMGKSAFANTVALNVAKMNKSVAIFNLEMGEDEVTQRLLSIDSSISLRSIQRGDMSDRQWQTFGDSTGRLSSLKLFIDDTPGLKPSQLRAKCRRILAEHGLDVVVVDYLGLMEGDAKSYGNQTALISYISRELKKLAKELDVTVIALSQLNRSVESRADKHPQLSDLRDSGSVEQDSDIVMFLYRDEYYNPETTERANIADLDIAKNRSGKTGMLGLYWNGELTRFNNLKSDVLSF